MEAHGRIRDREHGLVCVWGCWVVVLVLFRTLLRPRERWEWGTDPAPRWVSSLGAASGHLFHRVDAEALAGAGVGRRGDVFGPG